MITTPELEPIGFQITPYALEEHLLLPGNPRTDAPNVTLRRSTRGQLYLYIHCSSNGELKRYLIVPITGESLMQYHDGTITLSDVVVNAPGQYVGILDVDRSGDRVRLTVAWAQDIPCTYYEFGPRI